MKRLLMTALAIAILASGFASLSAGAEEISPVRLWKNIDDKSGKPKTLIRITDNNGEFRGKIEKLIQDAGEEPNPKCDKCEGSRKDQPLLGMDILSGVKRDGQEYNGGQILDPDNGKIYKCNLSVTDGGKKLNVRGYIGMSWLGRTQTWLREK